MVGTCKGEKVQIGRRPVQTLLQVGIALRAILEAF